jgi:hypothetical protein
MTALLERDHTAKNGRVHLVNPSSGRVLGSIAQLASARECSQ